MNSKSTQIETILQLVRGHYTDEFTRPLTQGSDIANLKKELVHLGKFLSREKNKKKFIINHLTECVSGNFFVKFPISQEGDELDVISYGLNTFIEELEAKTISRDYFSEIFNSIPQNVIVFDKELNIDLISIQNKDFILTEFDEEDKRIEKYLDTELLTNIKYFLANNLDNFEFEVSINKLLYNEKVLLCSLLHINLKSNSKILLVAKDITDKKNEELRILKATIQGQDMERKRLAYDLHDSLGQEFNSLKMHLNAISNKDSSTDSYKEVMGNVHLMLNGIVSTIQDITFDLMPSSLENNDLTVSVEQLVQRNNSLKNNIFCNFSHRPISLKDKKDELFVYRIIQEFVNNSMKYSQAKFILINLSLDKEEKQVVVHLRDKGIGFDMETVQLNNGINSIKQRLKTLNIVDYDFSSQVGEGTQLKFIISDL